MSICCCNSTQEVEAWLASLPIKDIEKVLEALSGVDGAFVEANWSVEVQPMRVNAAYSRSDLTYIFICIRVHRVLCTAFIHVD